MRYPIAISLCEFCKFDKTCELKHHNVERKRECPHFKDGPAIEPSTFTEKSVLEMLRRLARQSAVESLEDKEAYGPDEIARIDGLLTTIMSSDRDYINRNFLNQFACCVNCGKRLLSDSEIDEVIMKYKPCKYEIFLELLEERLVAKGFIVQNMESNSALPACCDENCREAYDKRMRMQIERDLQETEKGGK